MITQISAGVYVDDQGHRYLTVETDVEPTGEVVSYLISDDPDGPQDAHVLVTRLCP